MSRNYELIENLLEKRNRVSKRMESGKNATEATEFPNGSKTVESAPEHNLEGLNHLTAEPVGRAGGCVFPTIQIASSPASLWAVACPERELPFSDPAQCSAF